MDLNADDKLEAPSSSEKFEKFLTKKLKEPMQRYFYLRLIDFSHFKDIFVGEFDPVVLLVVFDTF